MNVGLFTALSGLQAAQQQMDISSHNLSNANTEGYSRQRVDLSASQPMGANGTFNGQAGPGNIPTGVTVQSITRVRDQYIDGQLHAESAPLGEASVKADTLKQVEDIFGEPSDTGLSSQMTKFFNGWQQLSGDPSNQALRTSLRQVGENLGTSFQDAYQKLSVLGQNVNDRVATAVDDINSLSRQIAGLNHEIKAALASNQQPNDLYDKQDLLITKLSTKVQLQVTTSSQGARSVYLGGQPLVADEHSFDLTAAPTQLNGYSTVEYGPTQQAINVPGGELKGLLDLRDKTLSKTDPTGVITQLNQLASGLMASVNAQHTIGFGTTGVTSQTFFDGTDASDIVVNANIENDTALAKGLDVIAAAANDPGSLTGGVSDSNIALKIAQLTDAKVMGGGNATFDTFYKNLITQVGTHAQEATRKVDTQTLLVNSVKARKDQVSGVSTDEEMANVLRFQKAYAASAKVVTVIDSMLDTLLGMVH